MLDGNLSCHMIYQDDDCIAILDKYPIDNGHSLIITKKPYEKITDMDVDETKDDYWEDIPQVLFELFKNNIQNKNYEYTMVKGHLWLEMEISLEP